MCMGCGATFLQLSDGQSPDKLETAFWLIGLCLWIILLHHGNAKLKQIQHHSPD